MGMLKVSPSGATDVLDSTEPKRRAHPGESGWPTPGKRGRKIALQ